MPTISPTAPGLSFEDFVRQSKPDRLKTLIGTGIIDVLGQLDPSLLSPDKLIELAIRLLNPETVLKTADQRDHVIAHLPLPKARELAQRLDVADGRNLYKDLAKAAASKNALPILYTFFGIVQEERAPAIHIPDIAPSPVTYPLFEHQRRAATRVLTSLARSPRKTVLHMPTGAGKTRTAMHVVARHLTNNEPTFVCWLAQNAELLEQAADEFTKAWQSLGNRQLSLLRFWGDRTPDLLAQRDGVIVSGLAKMRALDQRDPSSLLRLADRVSLVVVDEAHQAIAPTYANLISALHTKRANTALLGLTATPGRTWADIAEDRRLSDFFDGQKVTLEIPGYDNPVTYLIEQGYLARPTFHSLNAEPGLKLSDSDVARLAESIDVPDDVLEELGNDSKRNLTIAAAAEDLATRHSRIIIFTPSVTSARLVSAVLFARGFDTDVVTGDTPTSERERVIRQFKSSNAHPMILCNFGVLTTGFDAPSISAALIARPTRSLVLYSQMVGRATRGTRGGGNATAEILTVVDPELPGFGDVAEAFTNWEDVWNDPTQGH